MAEMTELVTIALVLAVALAGMLTRLIVPVVRGVWVAQTTAVAARVAVLVDLPLERSVPFDYAAGAARLMAAVHHPDTKRRAGVAS